jgi:hypothetical protein
MDGEVNGNERLVAERQLELFGARLPDRPIEMRALEALVERFRLARLAGLTFDGKRDMYEVLGYVRDLTPSDFRERYERGGIASRIVDSLPKATWRGEMELIEDEDPKVSTKFEQAWDELETRLKIRAVMERADILSGIGYYSCILIGAPGDFDQELPKGNGTPALITSLTPFSGASSPSGRSATTARPSITGGTSLSYGDAIIDTIETDVHSERFGLPKTYKFRRLDASVLDMQKSVHWSRVIHLAEGCLDNEVYGQPKLKAPWNLLDDLDKVTGGGAEAFWLRASGGTQLDVDKDMKLEQADKDALATQADEYQHQLRRMLRTRGVKVNRLGSDVADFSNPADAILTQIAGTTRIPKRILTGSEMGELASSQDRDNWKDQVNGRQTSYAGPYIVRQVVDRLIAYKYLPTPVKGPLAYEVRWPHIQTLTEQEKADGAAKWAQTNREQGTIVFTDDQIRDKWYGLPPLTPEERATAVENAKAMAGAKPAPQVGQPQFAAAEAKATLELVKILEDAIIAGDADMVARVLGIGDSE